MRTEKFPNVVYRTLLYGDVILAEFPRPVRMDLDMAKEIVESRILFAGNKQHFLVGDLSNVISVTPEAKEFLQLPNGGMKDILAAAFVATNPVAALIANVFVKSSKDFQTRFFSQQEEALRWIHEYRIERIKNSEACQ